MKSSTVMNLLAFGIFLYTVWLNGRTNGLRYCAALVEGLTLP